MKDSRMTIVVVSYDGYCDMWPDFFKLKKINWPDCPYETVLSNNTKSFIDDSVRVINCGSEAVWSTRTRTALKDINSKYICFILEDYFISSKVETSNFKKAIDLMEKEELLYYKLTTFSKLNTPKYKQINYLQVIDSTLKYGVSLQAAIWNREHFLSLIGDGDYNPWRFEVDRLNDDSSCDNLLGVYDNRNILNICHMAVQGKYLPSAIKEMRKKGYEINVTTRGIMSNKEYLIYSFKRWASQWTDYHPKFKKCLSFLNKDSVTGKNQ